MPNVTKEFMLVKYGFASLTPLRIKGPATPLVVENSLSILVRRKSQAAASRIFRKLLEEVPFEFF